MSNRNNSNSTPLTPYTHPGTGIGPGRLNAGVPFDLSRIPLRKNPPRHRKGEKFLKGPIPLTWLQHAAALPGKALAVSVAIWFLAGISNNRTVKLSGKLLRNFGLNRWAGYRALNALESAGLVKVNRRRGRCPEVTLVGEVMNNIDNQQR